MRDERRKTGFGGRRLFPRLPSFVSHLPLLLLALPAAADDAEKWYQVEVIIFHQSDRYGQEEPRRDIALSYPSNHLELFDPNLITDEDSKPGENEETAEDPIEITAPIILSTPEEQQPQQEQPFQVLEKSQRQLNNYATALRRRSGYQVLYHQAWRQPGIGSAQAPWILVRAGDRYGEHFELEGSLRLVRSRYLHLETNLWLSRFVENLDTEQLPGYESFEEGAEKLWPLLPDYPIVEIEPEEDVVEEEGLSPDNQPLGNFEGLTLEQPPTDPLFQIGELAPTEPLYKADEINLFKTSRRMRRDELHYLDHPKMGVLVQVTYYELPEVEAEEPEVTPTPLLPEKH